MSAARRDIELLRGEALFTVAHDPQRPFYVIAKGTLVRAVGTEFSVRIRDDQRIEVLVAEGRVLVGPPIVRASRSEPVLPLSTTALGPAQRALLGPGTVQLERLEPDSVVRRLAWRTGRIAFDGDALQDAIREFNRYNKRRLVIADPAIRDVRIGGMFDATDPESFVAALESSFGIQEAGSGGPEGDAVIRLVGRDVRTPQGP
jgi:transmembrane sensor